MSNVGEGGDELLVEVAESKEGSYGLEFNWSICIPPFPTIIPRYSTSSAENIYFSSLRYISCLWKC